MKEFNAEAVRIETASALETVFLHGGPLGLCCGLAITVLTDRGHLLQNCAKNNLRYRPEGPGAQGTSATQRC